MLCSVSMLPPSSVTKCQHLLTLLLLYWIQHLLDGKVHNQHGRSRFFTTLKEDVWTVVSFLRLEEKSYDEFRKSLEEEYVVQKQVE